jgi:hypothetical protein
MDHEFDLAFTLLDEAAERLGHQQYGTTQIPGHDNDYQPVRITTSHHYTREDGHHLVLLAADDYGLLAAVEATAPDLETEPAARIVKVRAGELTFHAVPGTWSYRTRNAGHVYTLTAGVGDEPMWTLGIDDQAPAVYDAIDEAIAAVTGAPSPVAA